MIISAHLLEPGAEPLVPSAVPLGLYIRAFDLPLRRFGIPVTAALAVGASFTSARCW